MNAMLSQMTPEEFSERLAGDVLEQERAWEPFAMLAAEVRNLALIVGATNGIECTESDFKTAADFMPQKIPKGARSDGKRRLSPQVAEHLDRIRYRDQ